MLKNTIKPYKILLVGSQVIDSWLSDLSMQL